jgi:ATP-dependent helicase/nuclease subunit A
VKQGELFSERPGEAREDPPRARRARAPRPAAPDADAAARAAAATVFDRPLLMEAGAGTGKTAALVARIVCWCLGPGWERAAQRSTDDPEETAAEVLSGVVAITFTEAAAAEMANRVAAALAALQAAAGDDSLPLPPGIQAEFLPEERAAWALRARALRSTLDQLTLCTIHAYCRRLLAAHPLEAGLAPGFTLDPTLAATDLVLREVFHEHLRRRWASGEDADLIELVLARHGPRELEQTLHRLIELGARAEDFSPDPLSEQTCGELRAALEQALRELLLLAAPLERLQGSPSSVDLVETLRATLELASAAAGSERDWLERAAAAGTRLWTKKRLEKLGKWAADELGVREDRALGHGRARFSARAADLEQALEPLAGLDPRLLVLGRRLIQAVLEETEAELRRRGIVSFSDLLRDAQDLLQREPALAAQERGRIRLLLVDEFQDTDLVQCGIVRALGLAPGPGPALFVVGDPKQSIYAWRNADLEAYDGFKEELVRAGGSVLFLTRNFRSRPAILREVERAVAPVMEEERGLQPAFVPLEPTRELSGDDSPPCEYWASWARQRGTGRIAPEGSHTTQASYEAEARAIAADVALRHAQGMSWRDAALLFRALTGVEPYLRALRERGVPYTVQSDRDYYRRREVIEAGALVRCVLDPEDQIALVAWLRSPIVGVPDAALLPLWKAGLPLESTRVAWLDEPGWGELEQRLRAAERSVPRRVPGLARLGDWCASLIAALRALGEARRSFARDPADQWVERLRALFLPEASEAARFLGAFRLANLERFFRELVGALEDGGDTQALLRTLRTNLARDRTPEISLPSENEEDALQVFTVHGAKGLEFRQVYLCQSHRPTRAAEADATGFVRRGGEVAYAFLGTHSPAWARAEQRRRAMEAAERVRLLYVAMTRAAERLVVLGGFRPGPPRAGWRSGRSFADLLGQRAGLPEALALLGQRPAQGASEPWVDEHGVAWKVAGGEEPRSSPPARAPAAARAQLPALESEARALALARQRAAQHARRPWHRPASEETHAERFTSAEPHAQPSLSRTAAQAVGTAVHRVLELADLAAGPEQALAGPALEPLLAGLVEPRELAPALERVRELLADLRANGLLERLCRLREHVLARELPVLLPPEPGPTAPVGFVSGAIDLLYRDPADRLLVVADYKTDALESAAEIAARAEHYRPQGRVYQAAVRQALGLDHDPRFELWFLHPGVVERLDRGAQERRAPGSAGLQPG